MGRGVGGVTAPSQSGSSPPGGEVSYAERV